MKLSDDEKFQLIDFYKDNEELWVTNQGVTRTQRLLKKEELVEEFGGNFKIEVLEKVFHGMRASFLREHKKHQEGNVPKKPWKFYEKMLFLKEGQTTKVVFDDEERETLITFFNNNPALWNHGLQEYRDRNIRRASIQKLVEEFDEKFIEEDIKREWNSLLTRYKREKKSEMMSKSSGAGAADVVNSNWEHYQQMLFLESTPETDSTVCTLNDEEVTLPAPKKSKITQESDAKAALWTALAKSLSSPATTKLKPCQPKTPGSTLEERAHLFGRTVANNLLQYDPKDWTLLKKKIFDLFFDYEQGHLTNATTCAQPFPNFGNITFPNGSGFQHYQHQPTNQHPTQTQVQQNPYAFSPCGSNNSG